MQQLIITSVKDDHACSTGKYMSARPGYVVHYFYMMRYFPRIGAQNGFPNFNGACTKIVQIAMFNQTIVACPSEPYTTATRTRNFAVQERYAAGKIHFNGGSHRRGRLCGPHRRGACGSPPPGKQCFQNGYRLHVCLFPHRLLW